MKGGRIYEYDVLLFPGPQSFPSFSCELASDCPHFFRLDLEGSSNFDVTWGICHCAHKLQGVEVGLLQREEDRRTMLFPLPEGPTTLDDRAQVSME